MPYQIEYRPGASRATLLYFGHLSGDDVADSYEDLLRRIPEAIPHLSVLHDARGAKSIVARPGELRRMVDALTRLQRRAPAGRAAYVGGPNHPMLIGVVRLVLKLMGPSTRERRVFTDYDAAVAWMEDGLRGSSASP